MHRTLAQPHVLRAYTRYQLDRAVEYENERSFHRQLGDAARERRRDPARPSCDESYHDCRMRGATQGRDRALLLAQLADANAEKLADAA